MEQVFCDILEVVEDADDGDVLLVWPDECTKGEVCLLPRGVIGVARKGGFRDRDGMK